MESSLRHRVPGSFHFVNLLFSVPFEITSVVSSMTDIGNSIRIDCPGIEKWSAIRDSVYRTFVRTTQGKAYLPKLVGPRSTALSLMGPGNGYQPCSVKLQY